jgi:hypothetical protein
MLDDIIIAVAFTIVAGSVWHVLSRTAVVRGVTSEGFSVRMLTGLTKTFDWATVHRPAEYLKRPYRQVSIRLNGRRSGYAVLLRSDEVSKEFISQLEQRIGLELVDSFRDLMRSARR